MTDTYTQFVNSPLGKQVASRLGIPRPVRLRRYTPGGALLEGTVVVGGYGDAPLAKRVRAVLDAEGIGSVTELPAQGRANSFFA